MTNAAISVENLSKRYRIGARDSSPDTLGSALTKALKTPFRNLKRLQRLSRFDESVESASDVLWAVKDVSFEVRPGERLGIVGRNGAGKSTLLKILSRITEPTAGRVITRGRVSSLLEVGTGFHPELTGRENIFLNGAVLGMDRGEISRKFDEIVDFSGVERFLDTPVKRYSSGMAVRLAFSVAAHLEPEILLVDEVLAVGDAEFQRKCLGKMESASNEGRTVLFVSHNMGAMLRLVDRCILMADGEIALDGNPQEVVNSYLENDEKVDVGEIEFPEDQSKVAQIRRIATRNTKGKVTSVLDPANDINVEIDFDVRDPGAGKIDVLALFSVRHGSTLSVLNTKDASNLGNWEVGSYKLTVTFPQEILNPGNYAVKGVVVLNGKAHDGHPQHGDGLGFELTAATQLGVMGYGMQQSDALLAIQPKYSLRRRENDRVSQSAK